ncbi:MAG TPA: class I SAM-dependent methyltransferase [Candidatus Methylomirabilis sp.]|nr:class I SAM-dependent methyltransferase [Candidatus Methylomirabilis sp.]
MSSSPLSRPPASAAALPCAKPVIAVTWVGDDGQKAAAAALARELALPLASSRDDDFDLLLVRTGKHLELHDVRHLRVGPVYVDYTNLDRRPYGRNLSRRQPLPRAFGKKVHTVVDATAGYGQDALLLALMGFRVTAIERSMVIAELTRDGLRRFEAGTGVSLGNRLRLVTGDARAILAALPQQPDAVYLDPMFPPKRKRSAAVNKEMRLLRDLVGDDLDAPDLLKVARGVARERVVVKRPDHAPPLAPIPSLSVPGKLVRYDVYLTHR